VNKTDSQFITTFGIVIGTLIAISILLLALARSVASTTQVVDVFKDPLYLATLQKNTAQPSQEAVAGNDNSAMPIAAQATAAPGAASGATAGATPGAASTVAVAAVPKNGNELFESVCKTCHGAGLAGAPKAGDKTAWAPRIAEGKATLYQHALNGYHGNAGVMPAKGGRTDLPDDLIKQGVDYMVSLAQ
jgi:cytochrome c5